MEKNLSFSYIEVNFYLSQDEISRVSVYKVPESLADDLKLVKNSQAPESDEWKEIINDFLKDRKEWKVSAAIHDLLRDYGEKVDYRLRLDINEF